MNVEIASVMWCVVHDGVADETNRGDQCDLYRHEDGDDPCRLVPLYIKENPQMTVEPLTPEQVDAINAARADAAAADAEWEIARRELDAVSNRMGELNARRAITQRALMDLLMPEAARP